MLGDSLDFDHSTLKLIIIQLEAMLQSNMDSLAERALMVFTRSDITPPKVN